MERDIRILRKVDHVLQRLATDHELALDSLTRVCLLVKLNLAVHGSYISAHLQVRKDLSKLFEVGAYE